MTARSLTPPSIVINQASLPDALAAAGLPTHCAPSIERTPPAASLTLEQAIGIQVRSRRRHVGLTVSELAAAASLSGGMLSKIENGQISPSLASLKALAAALNVPLAMFFATYDEKRNCSHVKADAGLVIERRGSRAGHQYALLGHALGGDVAVEPYLITLLEDAAPFTGFRHQGTEFIYMLTGEVVYRHADHSYHLRPGDALMFDAAAPHGPEALLSRPITYLSIMTHAREPAM